MGSDPVMNISWMKLGIAFVVRLYGGDESSSLNCLRCVWFSNTAQREVFFFNLLDYASMDFKFVKRCAFEKGRLEGTKPVKY